MPDLKDYFLIIFVLLNLCCAANAEIRVKSSTSVFIENITATDLAGPVSASRQPRIIIKPARSSRYKLGLAFSPEDLLMATNVVPRENYWETPVISPQNSERIIGFYIKSFF